MRVIVLALLFGVVSATQSYIALHNVLNSAPHTIRLAEIQSRVEAKGPIEQIGALCYQQLREIMLEIEQLDSTHNKFRRLCASQISKYNTMINGHNLQIARQNSGSAKQYLQWNEARPKLPAYRHRRDRFAEKIKGLEKQLVLDKAKRANGKRQYDTDMTDFAQALKDLDELKKIITGSALNNKQTSGNIAQQGFLQVVSTSKSDAVRRMTHRLTLGGEFLLEISNKNEPSGTDKLMNLIHKIRNEMWAEMDKLTKSEALAISRFKTHYLTVRSHINRHHVYRAHQYISMGRILSFIGDRMIEEGEFNVASAKTTKKLERVAIDKDFTEDSCAAEPPKYQKSRSTKMDEVSTINSMLKVLKSLKWAGAVYNAISRISVAGVDENPEPGFALKFQMDVHTGLAKNIYSIQDMKTKGFGRVAIKLEVGTTYVWASFDAYSKDILNYLIPDQRNGRVQQRYVKNLVVKKSPSANVEEGSSAQGNLEMWISGGKPWNAKKIPGAEDGMFDFGDERKEDKSTYGCFQVHDYKNKQTVLAVNNLLVADKHDIGIGNNKATGQNQPDWTHMKNSGLYKSQKKPVRISWYFQKAKEVTKAPTKKPVTKEATKKDAKADAKKADANKADAKKADAKKADAKKDAKKA